jgi:hypothetical protein
MVVLLSFNADWKRFSRITEIPYPQRKILEDPMDDIATPQRTAQENVGARLLPLMWSGSGIPKHPTKVV